MEKSTVRLLTAACTTAMSAGYSVGGMFDTPPAMSYSNDPYRSQGARRFKKSKKRKKIADKSKRVNRGKK